MRKGWALQRLENICKLRNGRAYKKPELLGDGRYRVLRVGNFFTNNHWYYSDLELDDTKYCSEGDLLYAWSASFGPRIWEGEKVIYHYHIWRVDFDGHQIDKYFLYYWFLWDAESIKKDQGAGTTMVHVSMKSMNARLINVPPLEEQKRIVAILDEAFAGIDTAIANTEKNLANARELFESYLNSVFTQRGEGWEERKLSDYARSISTGPFGSLLHKSDYVSAGVPLVNPINIQGDKIVPDENKLIDASTKQRLTSYVLEEGDVVIARRGEIGRCAAIDKEHAGWVCGTGCFFIRPEKELNPKFLANLIRSSNYRQQLEKASTGATMKNISNKSLGNLIIYIPSLNRQASILSRLDDLSMEIFRLESIYQQKLNSLKELKQSLLQKAFSGELTSKPDKLIDEAVA